MKDFRLIENQLDFLSSFFHNGHDIIVTHEKQHIHISAIYRPLFYVRPVHPIFALAFG